MPHALLVDDSQESLLEASKVFKSLGFSLVTTTSLAEGRDLLLREMPEIVLLGAATIARHRLEKLHSILTHEDFADMIEVHAVVPSEDEDAARLAARLGATHAHAAPLDPDELRVSLETYLDDIRSHTGKREVHESGRGLLVGESPPMRKLYRLIRKMATSECAVLVHGESGTGKELVSRTIHELSARSEGAFVAMNAGAVPGDLAESELFGHRKGAFTGADAARAGYFEQAAGGTLFIDEITEMPEELQVKLLRVLETGEYRRLGSEKTAHSDFRLISASNRDPKQAVLDGALREDLYYRIAQFPMRLPPLRERGEDIALLAEHFLAQECARNGQQKKFDKDALDMLRLQQWPGNVRELRNCIAQAWILAGERITAADLPEDLGGEAEPSQDGLPIGQPLEDVERQMILKTLEQCDGNKRKTAETLGISVKTLYNRLKAYEQD